jgi:hypothetical protein
MEVPMVKAILVVAAKTVPAFKAGLWTDATLGEHQRFHTRVSERLKKSARVYLLRGGLAVALALTSTGTAKGGGDDCMSPCWRMVSIGVYKNVAAMRDALADAEHKVSVGQEADEIMGRPLFPYAQSLTRLRLYRLKGSELGYQYDGNISLGDVYQRASELEYDTCPAEVAPMLRLSYLDQPPGEFLDIAHLPVHRYGGQPIRLTVGYDGWSFLLVSKVGDLETEVLARSLVFVFCKRL